MHYSVWQSHCTIKGEHNYTQGLNQKEHGMGLIQRTKYKVNLGKLSTQKIRLQRLTYLCS